MFELFLNPANIVVGGALISSPIIIHLINRMRYKRIRWAAMEFLLKSQKRNRRRLIIEQLILLLLRIILVLLAGLLLARFLGFSFAGLIAPHNTTHLVILDDRLSMTDHWRTEEGEHKNSFDIARQLIEKEIAKPASQARTPQRLVLFRLSALQKERAGGAGDVTWVPEFDERLNDASLQELGKKLAQMEDCTALHLDMKDGVTAAQEILNKNARQDERFLHIVTDFRQRQWGEPEGTALTKALEGLTNTGAKVNLVDAAHPVRGENQKVPLYHDNLAIIDLRPDARVAADSMPLQFTVSVANYSPSERKNIRVTVKVDGIERPEGSLTMLSVPPGVTSQTFQVSLLAKPDSPTQGFSMITATLENEEVGLQADNLRYAVVEVRRQVPLLLIDGDPTTGEKPGGDTYHLRALFTAARGYDVVRGTLADLERPNLEQYATVYLLNIRGMNEKALKNLEAYVQGGGSAAFFMGERVNDPDFYNKYLYANGTGLFPVPLAPKPTEPLSETEKAERFFDKQAKVYVRNESHPMFVEAFKDADEKKFLEASFKFLTFDRYYPIQRSKWEMNKDRMEELVTLPNRRPLEDYRDDALKLRETIPANVEKFQLYQPALERHQRAIRDSLTGKNLYELANALDAFLKDVGEPADPKRPSLLDFWNLTDLDVQKLKSRTEKLLEAVRYGDPLLVTNKYGKGRTIAFLSTAGTKWNDWAAGSPGSASFSLFLDLQKFLMTLDTSSNLTVGTARLIQLDGTRYLPKVHVFFQSEPREGEAGKKAPAPDAKEGESSTAGVQDMGELVGGESAGLIPVSFARTYKPGIYYFDLTQRADTGGEPKTERRAFAYNVDGLNESDLKRSPQSDLEKLPQNAVYWHTIGSHPNWAKGQTDLSESAWFYLLFLIILVAEQALAVHLSFHLKGNEAAPGAQAARAQPAAA